MPSASAACCLVYASLTTRVASRTTTRESSALGLGGSVRRAFSFLRRSRRRDTQTAYSNGDVYCTCGASASLWLCRSELLSALASRRPWRCLQAKNSARGLKGAEVQLTGYLDQKFKPRNLQERASYFESALR